ncbi:hypothetical protein BC831DRAFT_554479 [Entophlyctis helioformis]|nr:hypothetical protein BC831DRAFT_554479 [Entophlyctis helioformis]
MTAMPRHSQSTSHRASTLAAIHTTPATDPRPGWQLFIRQTHHGQSSPKSTTKMLRSMLLFLLLLCSPWPSDAQVATNQTRTSADTEYPSMPLARRLEKELHLPHGHVLSHILDIRGVQHYECKRGNATQGDEPEAVEPAWTTIGSSGDLYKSSHALTKRSSGGWRDQPTESVGVYHTWGHRHIWQHTDTHARLLTREIRSNSGLAGPSSNIPWSLYKTTSLEARGVDNYFQGTTYVIRAYTKGGGVPQTDANVVCDAGSVGERLSVAYKGEVLVYVKESRNTRMTACADHGRPLGSKKKKHRSKGKRSGGDAAGALHAFASRDSEL